MLMQDVCLADHDLDIVIGSETRNPIEEFIEEYIHKMLIKAKELFTGQSSPFKYCVTQIGHSCPKKHCAVRSRECRKESIGHLSFFILLKI